MFDEKAQLHTLEGATAAAIMLMIIIYAIDATTITPLTSSTANVHVESELQLLGQDILSALDYAEPGYDSELRKSIVNWSGDMYIWNGSAYVDVSSTSSSLNNSLTDILNRILVKQGIAHNVEITFLDNVTLMPSSLKMINNGDPSDNAVIVSRKLVLHNSDINSSFNPSIKDIDPSTNLYNILDIKLTLWRM